tara:strand:+ start:376 stop:693 length:318 start_codon:yes stop_codon:yes gene_type:complete
MSAIVRVLFNLIQKHGIPRGIKMAQKLGFGNKSIKQAFKAINKEQKKVGLKELKHRPKRPFDQRKADRMYHDDMLRERKRRLRDDWVDGQTGPTHDIWGRQGIDW